MPAYRENTPEISILMGVYNSVSTLAAAMDSVLSQSFENFEFVICDDASTDGSWDMLCAYRERDPRVVLIRNEKNLGLGTTLNRCLSVARGRYIARQDADDISEPERLERTLRYLQNTNAPYAGCGVLVFDDGGIWSKRLFPEKITRHIIAQKNPFFHPTMLFRREVMEAAGGYRVVEYTRRTEDYDLVMRLAGRGIIGQNLQEYLYHVYEPMDAYKRHTLRTRWYEIRTRVYGLRRMRSPAKDYIYLVKPVIMCLIPRFLRKYVKKLQWTIQSRKEQ